MIKVVSILVVVLTVASLINWVRDGQAWPVMHTFPLLGGHAPSWLYDGGACVAVTLFLWGISRLRNGDAE